MSWDFCGRSFNYSFSFCLLFSGIFTLIRAICHFVDSSFFMVEAAMLEGKQRRQYRIGLGFYMTGITITFFHIFIRKIILQIRLDECGDALLFTVIPIIMLHIFYIW